MCLMASSSGTSKATPLSFLLRFAALEWRQLLQTARMAKLARAMTPMGMPTPRPILAFLLRPPEDGIGVLVEEALEVVGPDFVVIVGTVGVALGELGDEVDRDAFVNDIDEVDRVVDCSRMITSPP